MPTLYQYRARDRSGELVSGVIQGENVAAVESYLESMDFSPVKISQRTEFSLKHLFGIGAGKARLEDLILTTRKLATLYRAGIPILKSLEIVAEQYEGAHLGKVLLSIRDDLEKGEHLSESMAKHPRIFSPIFVSSVKAAEATGKLDMVLEQLSEALEKEMVTREEIKKALRYPISVIIAIIVAFAVLTTFVIPKFAEFYSSYGAQLPMPTRILIAIGDVMSSLWYVIFPAFIAVVVGGIRLVKHPKMKPHVDAFYLKLPVFGNLIVKTCLARFAHVLSVLVASGIPLIQSLEIVKDAVGNQVISGEIAMLAEFQRQGRSLAESKHHLHHFPKLAISLIHVGLESGTLDLTLSEISRFFDREVKYTSSRLTSLLEPILILIIGGMVLFLALAIFLPMWSLISVFKG